MSGRESDTSSSYSMLGPDGSRAGSGGAVRSPTPSQAEFKAIYKQHAGLVQYVLKPFRFRQEVEKELIQECFLKIFQTWERIDQVKLKSFIVVMARNLAIDHLRKMQTERTDITPVNAIQEGTLWNQNPRRLAEMAVAEQFIDEVSRSPGGECFGLFYRDNLSIREICERLGESSSAVTSRLTRLRQKFKENLKQYLDEID